MVLRCRLSHSQRLQTTFLVSILDTAGQQQFCTATSNRQLYIYCQKSIHLTHSPQSTLSTLGWTRSKSISLHHSIFGHQLRNRAFSTTETLYSVGIEGHCAQRWHSTSSIRPTHMDNEKHSTSTDSMETTSKEEQSRSKEGFQLVYTAPLKGAVRAIKIFSLTTATAAVLGGPILVWMGNQSVPLSGRVIMSSLVMLVGISTTALLHWLVKGYVIQMYFDEDTKTVQLYTLSMFGRKKLHQFNISEAGPPSSATAFSSFQARGKSYFLHAEVFKDRKVLSGLLGAYSELETSDM